MSASDSLPYVCAVLLAAGRSSRLARAGDVRKPLMQLAGRSVFAHTCDAFARARCIRTALIVTHPEDEAALRREAATTGLVDRIAAFVPGGDERTDSVRAGVAALPAEAELVLVHDVARPLIKPAHIRAVALAAHEHGGAVLAVPVSDTIKRSTDADFVAETLDRRELWAAQTPQGFRTEDLRSALERAQQDAFKPTDDAALYERYSGPVKLVEGDPSNRKLTLPEDIPYFETMLRTAAGGDT